MFGMHGSTTSSTGGFGRQSGFENYHGTIDPEELFRKIFGSSGFNFSSSSNFNDFAESQYGFDAASEVSGVILCVCNCANVELDISPLLLFQIFPF